MRGFAVGANESLSSQIDDMSETAVEDGKDHTMVQDRSYIERT